MAKRRREPPVFDEAEALARVKDAGARLAATCKGGGISSITISTAGKSVTLTYADAKRLRNEAAMLRGKK